MSADTFYRQLMTVYIVNMNPDDESTAFLYYETHAILTVFVIQHSAFFWAEITKHKLSVSNIGYNHIRKAITTILGHADYRVTHTTFHKTQAKDERI